MKKRWLPLALLLALNACIDEDDDFDDDDDGTGEIEPLGEPCGDFVCTVGSVCIFRDTSVAGQPSQGFFDCQPNPCAPERATCVCAGLSVCGVGGFCAQNGDTLVCSNPP